MQQRRKPLLPAPKGGVEQRTEAQPGAAKHMRNCKWGWGSPKSGLHVCFQIDSMACLHQAQQQAPSLPPHYDHGPSSAPLRSDQYICMSMPKPLHVRIGIPLSRCKNQGFTTVPAEPRSCRGTATLPTVVQTHAIWCNAGGDLMAAVIRQLTWHACICAIHIVKQSGTSPRARASKSCSGIMNLGWSAGRCPGESSEIRAAESVAPRRTQSWWSVLLLTAYPAARWSCTVGTCTASCWAGPAHQARWNELRHEAAATGQGLNDACLPGSHAPPRPPPHS